MQKFLVTGLGLVALLALPAMADGYETGKKAQRGPAPLAPHAKHVEVHKIEVQPPHMRQQACVTSCCYSACPTISYGRTYVTEPVVTRQYTRTYTRMAPPDCVHTSSSYYAPHYREHHSTHDHHSHEKYHSRHHGQADYGRSYTTTVQPARPAYPSGPVYEEDTVIWESSAGQRHQGYRPAQTSYHQPQHLDRGQAWAHYDHSWKSRTNQGR